MTKAFDAVIIGGGPAGSTAGAVLAQHGRRPLILEKSRFPRYHVGESLLPYCYFPLERIGMIDKLKASCFIKKFSVQFIGTSGKVSEPFYFHTHLNHEASQTWQVMRDKFDRMLLDNALEHGAVAIQGITVRELITEGDTVVGVVAEDDEHASHEFRAPVTLDASGRDAFAMHYHDWRVRDPKLKKIAIWTYYRGARRDEGIDEGATTIAYVPEKGWFWYIPLPNDMVSVGIVAERDYLYRHGKNPAAIFDREIKANPWIEDHLAPGERVSDYQVTGDYSYRSKFSAADGLVLVGDAFAFLDPVFSSGIFLALTSGVLAGDAVHRALEAGDVAASQFSDYSQTMCEGLEAMRKLVYAFYDETFSFGKVLKAHPEVRGDLTDCLIGHVFKDLAPLWDAVGRFARLPEPLPHGRPLVTVP